MPKMKDAQTFWVSQVKKNKITNKLETPTGCRKSFGLGGCHLVKAESPVSGRHVWCADVSLACFLVGVHSMGVCAAFAAVVVCVASPHATVKHCPISSVSQSKGLTQLKTKPKKKAGPFAPELACSHRVSLCQLGWKVQGAQQPRPHTQKNDVLMSCVTKVKGNGYSGGGWFY